MYRRLFLSLAFSTVFGLGCAISVFPGPEAPSIPPPPTDEALAARSAPAQPAAVPAVPVDVPPAQGEWSTDVERWAVQVASIQNRDAAHEAQVGLAERAFPAYVLTYPSPEGTWYRVRVGPFGDRGSAEAIEATLQDFGYSTWIVAEE